MLSEADNVPKNKTSASRIISALLSLLDPRAYIHIIKIVHYYNYTHVQPRRHIRLGTGSRMAPNVSLRNGERIVVGKGCHIGERSYIWAGDYTGRIVIGDNVSLGPEVFLTAADYQFQAGRPFREQPKSERDIVIGNDVWLGTRVIVTAGVTIGNGCIVGAGSVVTKDIPDNSIAVGVPARVISSRRDL